MPKRIHYIASNPVVLSVLSQYIQSKDFEWLEYSIPERPEAEYLMIVEPFQIGSELYALSSAWKPWLMEFRPNTRLIVTAFAQSRHSNCLNLLDLPDNLETWIQKVPPLSDFPMADTGKGNDTGGEIFIDPWGFGLVKPGYDLQALMRKFVTGHEESKSFFAQMVAMQQQFEGLQYYRRVEMEMSVVDFEKTKVLGEGLVKNWDYFIHRWNHYSKVFKYVPYQEAIQKINGHRIEMNGILKNEQYLETKNPLKEILQIMNKEMKRYIFPEHYW